jgi:Tol biopolymer transport system component
VVATGVERTLVRVRLAPRFEHVGEPAWSLDGSTIAYTHYRLDREHDFRPLIRLVPASGGESRTLIWDAQAAAWSPDGGRLAFASVRDRNGKRCGSDECNYAGEIYIAGVDGSGLRRLTANDGDDAYPAWSADGSRILFSSDRNLPEGELERGLLDRGRRQLPHVADERHTPKRVGRPGGRAAAPDTTRAAAIPLHGLR